MKEIWCTLGVLSFHDRIIKELSKVTNLFRLNLSHTKICNLTNLIAYIRDATGVPLCLDTDCGKYQGGNLGELTKDDRLALSIGNELGIKNVALSFSKNIGEINRVKEIIPDAKVISKIESKEGIDNLDVIIRNSSAILIDRGDLSGEVSIEKIPNIQKRIIRKGHWENRKVYVATNMMESMMHKPQPTPGEVNDVYNTLLDGADGIVLAGETAIGQYPVETANMIKRIINEFERV